MVYRTLGHIQASCKNAKPMFSSIRIVLLFALFYLWLLPAHAQWQVQDGIGHTVTLQHPLRKIVSLAPHTTELLYSAGAGSKIVGVTQENDYPAPIQQVAKVGAYNQINLEAIVALKPDLIVAWQDGGQQQIIEQFKKMGMAVFVSQPLELSDIATEIHALGVLNGTPNIAKQNTYPFRAYVQEKQHQPITANINSAFLVGLQPIYAISNHSFLGKMMQTCGAHNVFGHFTMPAIALNHEALLQQPLEIVFVSGEQSLPQWQQLYAHSTKRPEIYPIDADLRPSLRIKSSLEQMCLIIETKRRSRH